MSVALRHDNSQGLNLSRDPERVAHVAAKAFSRVAEIWGLNNAQAAALIDVSARTWARMKTGTWTGTLKRDQLMRISALTGLYKALHLYFGEALADRWVSLPNDGPLFGGRTPLFAMTEGGLPAQMDARDYVDALRGGL